MASLVRHFAELLGFHVCGALGALGVFFFGGPRGTLPLAELWKVPELALVEALRTAPPGGSGEWLAYEQVMAAEAFFVDRVCLAVCFPRYI